LQSPTNAILVVSGIVLVFANTFKLVCDPSAGHEHSPFPGTFHIFCPRAPSWSQVPAFRVVTLCWWTLRSADPVVLYDSLGACNSFPDAFSCIEEEVELLHSNEYRSLPVCGTLSWVAFGSFVTKVTQSHYLLKKR
jgi:hypothetical protein